MELFSVTCETCTARLKVRDASAVGQILECPKCKSFVHIQPPPGWRPSQSAHGAGAAPSNTGPDEKRDHRTSASALSGQNNFAAKPAGSDGAITKSNPAAAGQAPGTAARGNQSGGPESGKKVRRGDSQVIKPQELQFDLDSASLGGCGDGLDDEDSQSSLPDTVLDPEGPAHTLSGSGVRQQTGLAAMAAAGISLAADAPAAGSSHIQRPKGAAQPAPADETPAGSSQRRRAADEPKDSELGGDAAPSTSGASRKQLLTSRWTALVVVPLVATVAISGWYVLRRGEQPVPPRPSPHARQPTPPAPPPEVTQVMEKPAPVLLGERWLPADTRGLVTLELSSLVGQPAFATLIQRIDPMWQQGISPLTEGLGIRPGAVRRLTWAAVDLSQWRKSSVVIIELAEPLKEPAALEASTEAVDLQLGDARCRQKSAGPWTLPFALVDAQTLVTGPRELLEKLADKPPNLSSEPLAVLLQTVGVGRHGTLLVDMSAAREAGLALPPAWQQHVPAPDHWQTLWEMAEGAAIGLHLESRQQVEMHLLCRQPSVREKILAALRRLAQETPPVLQAHIQELPQRLKAGVIDARSAMQVDQLLKQGLEAFTAVVVGEEGDLVFLRTHVGAASDNVPLAVIDSVPAWERLRLAASTPLDEANHRELMRSLQGFDAAEQALPAGAAGSPVIPPNRRLSWLATLLPYCEHLDWAQQLNYQRPWNDPVNDPVTRQFFAQAINPSLGREKTESGYPVTHYVGVAGVGADAADLPATHERAGLFGHDRRRSLGELSDGQSHTLAILGTSARTGPWASGGDATVRGLTKAPYVNGPDGFGSGRADGMLGALADGSVRFFSSKTDPRILEQLATVRGERPELPPLAGSGMRPQPMPPVQPMPQPPMPQPPMPMPPVEVGPQLNIAALLAERLASVEADAVPLGELLEYLSELSTVPIVMDLEAMADLAITPDTTVSIKLQTPTVEDVLQAAVAQVKLGFVIERGQVLVTDTDRRRQQITEVRYPVSDLCAGSTPEDLAAMVVAVTEPTSWTQRGGQGRVVAQDQNLVVTNRMDVQGQVLSLLEKLRTARGLKTRQAGMALASRYAAAAPQLERPYTVNFAQPTRLRDILDFLQERSGCKLLLDPAVPRDDDISGDTETTLQANGEPLDEILHSLARSVGLAVRISDARTFVFTTRKAAAASYELEFYPVADLLSGPDAEEALLDRIRRHVAGDTWQEAGGQGVLMVDKPSKHLLVWQTQNVQRQIELNLARWREPEKPPRKTGDE